MRMKEDATRRLTLLGPDGGRRRGRPKLKWKIYENLVLMDGEGKFWIGKHGGVS